MRTSLFNQSSRLPKVLLLSTLFTVSLLYFVFGSGWYEPSRLLIHGQAKIGAPLLQIRWDSGGGFNDYEKREFRPFIQPLDEQNNNTLIFGAAGQINSATLGGNVVCTAIIIDGENIDLRTLAKNIPYREGGLSFSPGETLSLPVQATAQISLRFRTTNRSGVASISVNGVESEHDLYMPNVEAKYKQFDYWLLLPDGSFSVEMEMPRYAIDELEIMAVNDIGSSLQLNSVAIHGKGHIVDLLQGQSATLGAIHFFDVLKSMRSYFHPIQFLQQICFAFITTWLLSSLVRLYKNVGSVRACFFEEKRFVFWGGFGCSLIALGIWVAAFWPGVMSVDSLKVWRAAMLPDVYLNDHPVLNVFLYKYLYQLWGDPAVVAVAQVILMALLFSWFGFWLYRQGVSKKILLPWLLFGVCAVPVGSYTIMLWKDVPFALLVVFWACTLVKLYRERKRGTLFWTGQQVVALLLLGLALGLIRHNGIVFFAVLPIMFVVLRLVPVKKALITLSILIATGILGLTVLQYTKRAPGLGFIAQQIQHYAGEVSVQNIVKDSERVMEDYVKVLDFDKTLQQWDKFHYYFKDRYAYWFLLHSGWWKLYPYQKETVMFPRLRQAVMKIYEKSYQKPWVWLSWNPVWLLALLPVVTLLFWWFPHTAVLGVVLLAGALPLVYLRVFNWRYYYFLYLGLLFIIPLISLDLTRRNPTQVAE